MRQGARTLALIAVFCINYIPNALAQAPQLRGSDCRLTQVPLQLVSPEGQTHWLPEQVVPAGQVTPHPPQLSGSLVMLVQPPEQSTWPPEHWAGQGSVIRICPF